MPTTQDYFLSLTSALPDTEYSIHINVTPVGQVIGNVEYVDPDHNIALSWTDYFLAYETSFSDDLLFPNGEIIFKLAFIGSDFYEGTNLRRSEIFISLTDEPDRVTDCLLPIHREPRLADRIINGVSFVHYVLHGVFTGNIVEQHSFRTVHGDACYEIAYLIRYTNIGNYPSLTVEEFDHEGLVQMLEAVIDTFQLLPE